MSVIVGKNSDGTELFRLECEGLLEALRGAESALRALDDADELSPTAFDHNDVGALLMDLEALRFKRPTDPTLKAIHDALTRHRLEVSVIQINPYG